jgi:ABC-type uncharacterized transport system involved in gliding motility auxiliary subunit
MSFEKMKESVQEFRWVKVAPWAFGIGIISLTVALVAYLVRGTFDAYIYVPLLIGAVGFLSFAFLDPDRLQIWLGSRQARYGTNLLITSLALVAIVVVVNYIVYTAGTQTTLWVDLTESKSNSLSDETIRTLHTLTEPIEIRAWFGPESTSWDTTRALLDKYTAESRGMLTYTKVDPEANPVLAKQDGVSKDGTLIFLMGEQKQLITTADETNITTAIIKLINPGEHFVYFLTGHGEASIDGSGNTDINTLVGALRNKNYTVDKLNLTEQKKVPENASVLIIAGPKKPLQDFELTAIQDYLKAGGSLILMQNPYAVTQMDPSTDILAAYLKKDWGISLHNDIIIDLVNHYFLNPFASNYPSGSTITEHILGTYSVFPTAMSLEVTQAEGKSFTPVAIVQIEATKDQAWGETDLNSVGLISFLAEKNTATFDKEKDNAAPLTVAVSAEDASITSTNPTKKTARVVVFGDEDFAENQMINQGSGANEDLITNAVDWASEQENLINITPKTASTHYISLPTDTWVLNAIVLTSICLLPGSFIVLYGIVWYNRRKHR